MNTKQKAVLQSKLTVYKVYYQHAERKKDQKRMEQIETFIDELQEQIENSDS
ncbi:hypothetical protein [Caproiciproducens galactitolivorans]|uniref:Uncharacterized protein n=1 Tax=Caproiciproducens galactitolivorans TaxID=642589 RepID=A0A4Z0YGK2_9FIRM|nr:hypothetical protein [Caproiciproducens galactitolivorans]TGJ77863.1 hypothetical protein CAGA_02690 [Caproiciproducens galactitolivorans]